VDVGRRAVSLALAAVLTTACSAEGARPREQAVPTAEPAQSPAPRKQRAIPVHVALARLRRHVDVPVVLPRDRLAGLRNYRGWVADRKYLEWERRGGRTVGTLVLRRDHRVLWIRYGYAEPDGCGGRDTAVPTEVLGEPALLWVVRGGVWSEIVWPVRPRGHVGSYGLAGSFDAPDMLRLAESMETALRKAPARDDGC
jgi:hypothetical protein